MIQENDRFLCSNTFLYIKQHYETGDQWKGKNIWDINYNQIVNIFSTQFFTVKKWVKEEAESIPKGSNQGTVKMWENI